MRHHRRSRPRKAGDIDIVVVVDSKEMIRKAGELEGKMDGEYDLHLTTLETFESRLFLR